MESTLRKAVQRGDVALPSNKTPSCVIETGATKSERSREDAEAADGMGMACTRADERMEVAIGLASSAATRFEPCLDVIMGGLLVGMPALCANGLLSGIDKYMTLPRGFYSCMHILFVMGFMALGRIRRLEGLRHTPPGEFGKVNVLDRVPEVRTLREKITMMANSGDPALRQFLHPRRWNATT